MGGFAPTDPFAPQCDPIWDPFCDGSINDPVEGGFPPIIIIGADAATLASVERAVSALATTIGGLKSIAGLITGAIARVLSLGALLWTSILKPLLEKIRAIAKRIDRILEKILKPQLDAMKAARQAILDIYNRFIRPFIVLIESIRRVIRILQLLHIHVFDALDRQLAKLEGKLLAPIIAALQRVNTLGNWVSFILNLRLLIHRGLLLGSIKQNIGGTFNLVASAPAHGFVASDAAAQERADLSAITVHSFVASAPRAIAETSTITDSPIRDLFACWGDSLTLDIGPGSPVGDAIRCMQESVNQFVSKEL